METNIDYKALYEEARERAKQVKLTDTKENVAAAEYIFPDLKESEDERIRKELIEFIKWSVDRHFMREDFHQAKRPSEWIAYLEKQKGNSLSLVDAWKEMRTEVFAQASGNKPKPESDEFTKLFSLNDIDFLISDLDSRGIKPKPAEKQDYSGLNDFERAIHRGFLCAGVENVPVTIIKETAHDCLAHLPAEWSDKDKNIFKLSLDLIKHSDDCDGILDQELAVKWFAELPSRFVPQPKPSWIEEDERILKGIIGKIDHDQTYGVSKDEMLNFLKQL